MDKSVTLSIIVLSYNNEQYIEDCLKSLELQHVDSYEVYVIDDSSTDGSVAVIQKFIQNKPQFKLIEKENSGGALSSQIGLSKAKGEYCAIVDSDDIVAEGAYGRLIERIKKDNSDFAAGLPVKLTNGFMYSFLPTANEKNIFSCDRVLSTQEEKAQFANQGFYWNAVYKTDFIKRNAIEMPEDLLIADRIFVYKAIMRAARISIDKDIVYFWRKKGNDEKLSLTDSTAEFYMISDRCDSFEEQIKLCVQEAAIGNPFFNKKIWEASLGRLFFPLYSIVEEKEYKEFVNVCERYRFYLVSYKAFFVHLIINTNIPLNTKYFLERILTKNYKDLYNFLKYKHEFLELDLRQQDVHIRDAILKECFDLSIKEICFEDGRFFMYIQMRNKVEQDGILKIDEIFANNRYFNRDKISLQYDAEKKRVDITELVPATYIINTICTSGKNKQYVDFSLPRDLSFTQIYEFVDRTITFNPFCSMLIIHKKNRFTLLRKDKIYYLGVNEDDAVKDMFFFNITENKRMPIKKMGSVYSIVPEELYKGTNILIYQNKDGFYNTVSKYECSNGVFDLKRFAEILTKGRVEIEVK